ncbi:predicted patatin/cPLA2 family phospholipase [Bacillus oleivorans]|uniref:Predicted patatin/cPLA2 family phospholipase n=1 Tax=Bacillus oleivorans TaxID=1448271 RepID=A0A285D553_9BACI|nr:patatin family protein [Bacillus oleivorans]SNX74944.1 predicted patatin/cPLA2 family phospholipase [Bacillus oleivorans]
MKNIGLVLEGGGLRGVYTAGVLEFFMEKDLYFPYVIGVSAGAGMAASYLSRQKGRNWKVNIDLAIDPRYVSFRNWIRNKEVFGMDFIFDEIPNQLVPFDYDTFLKAEEHFIIGTTDCETGEPVYYSKDEHGEHMLKIIRASSSLPFLAPSVEYDNRKLLDGGIIDPIPIRKAQKDGNIKNVVIMTKPPHYRKKKSKLSMMLKYLSKKQPKIGEVLLTRHTLYNETLQYLQAEKERGNVFIIQPSVDIPVSRIERNQEKLIQLYELGMKDAEKLYQDLNLFIFQK